VVSAGKEITIDWSDVIRAVFMKQKDGTLSGMFLIEPRGLKVERFIDDSIPFMFIGGGIRGVKLEDIVEFQSGLFRQP